MSKEIEIQNLIEYIPNHSDYQKAKLQISLPTSSSILPSDALKIINEHAVGKGWSIDDITVIKKSGYIACSDCNKSIHIHVTSGQDIHCMNCGQENVKRTQASVNIVYDEDR